jgi:hypothetical protein
MNNHSNKKGTNPVRHCGLAPQFPLISRDSDFRQNDGYSRQQAFPCTIYHVPCTLKSCSSFNPENPDSDNFTLSSLLPLRGLPACCLVTCPLIKKYILTHLNQI